MKKSQIASCVAMCFSHEHNEIGVSLSNLWFSHISIKKDHEPWDGGGPI